MLVANDTLADLKQWPSDVHVPVMMLQACMYGSIVVSAFKGVFCNHTHTHFYYTSFPR